MSEEKSKNNVDRVLSSISIGSIVDGFANYRRIGMKIIKQRGNFASIELISKSSKITFYSALSVFLYGVALSFLLYLPLTMVHVLKLEKIYFLLQFIYLQSIVVFLVYLSSKVFRGQGTLRMTAIAYLIFVGVFSPLMLLIGYPIFFYLPIEDFVSSSTLSSNDIMNLPNWVMIWNGLVFLLMLVIGFILLVRWIADVHLIRRSRLVLALLIVYMPIMYFHNIYFAPYVTKILQLFSEMLGKLA